MSKKCTPLWREAHFEVKMNKTHHSWTTFGSCDVEKVHAVVARSTFRSQNVQNTPGSDHFWKLRCRKSARRCGAKHISKSKGTKHTRFGPRRCGAKNISKSKCTKHQGFGSLLEVEMSKKCKPLWREAHFQVKRYKAHQVRTTLEVAMSKKCTPLWREAHFQVKMYKTHQVRTTPLWGEAHLEVKMLKNTRGSDHFWTVRCHSAWQAQGIVDLDKSEQNVRVLQHFQKRWQAWDI